MPLSDGMTTERIRGLHSRIPLQTHPLPLMRLSRSLPCTLLAFVLVPFLFAPAALAQTPARTVSNAVPLDAEGEVAVNNHEGSITVTTWDRDRVRYEAEIMPTDEEEDEVNYRGGVNGGGPMIRLESDDGDFTLRSG